MASLFKIGATVEVLTSLDALTIPLPDPQPEFRKYVKKDKLADGLMKGRGPTKIIWEFPLLEVAEVGQANAYQSASPIYIQSLDEDDAPQVYEVLMNVPDPRESGDHAPRMRGIRNGLLVEFIVISEVA